MSIDEKKQAAANAASQAAQTFYAPATAADSLSKHSRLPESGYHGHQAEQQGQNRQIEIFYIFPVGGTRKAENKARAAAAESTASLLIKLIIRIIRSAPKLNFAF